MDEMVHYDEESAEDITPDIEALRTSPARFVNREVSWLQFNMRVLEEAANPNHPLLERLRFVSISANNLDEFFMVRVAGLKGQLRAGAARERRRMTPTEQLEEISTLAQHLHLEQQDQWQAIREELFRENIVLLEESDLGPNRSSSCKDIPRGHLPVLTPIAIDPAHPFPLSPIWGSRWPSSSRGPVTTRI